MGLSRSQECIKINVEVLKDAEGQWRVTAILMLFSKYLPKILGCL